jgi:hypothetical protein
VELGGIEPPSATTFFKQVYNYLPRYNKISSVLSLYH